MTFDPDLNLSHIYIIGCGGTGAHLTRLVARMIYDMRARNLHTPAITLIDPDTVEEGNIGRQLFSPHDIGFYKAQTLATRYNVALGLEIRAINAAFDPAMLGSNYGTLLISAVDNDAARRAIDAAGERLTLDCGNALSHGQLVIGNCRQERMQYDLPRKNQPAPTTWRYLPHPYTVFPQLLEPELQPIVAPNASCAALIAASQQHLLINDLMATTAAAYVYRLLHRQPLETWISFVDLDPINIQSIPVSLETIRHYGHYNDSRSAA